MYDENQTIKIKWEGSGKKRYESKGYVFTKNGDEFDVCAKDLLPNSHVKISVTCDYCGELYSAVLKDINRGRRTIEKDACVNCQPKKTSEAKRNKYAKKLLGKARDICTEKGYVLLTKEDEYTDAHMTIVIDCQKHGQQNVTLWAMISSNAGCPRCARELVAMKNTLDVDYVEQYINSINGNKLLNKNDYKTRKTPNLKILCSCGDVYTTSFGCYILGVQQCFSCSCKESKPEKCIREFLDGHKIEFEKEYKFDDCKDINPLPFDFYLPQNNLLIEFDGQHHYEPVYGKEQYEATVKHDNIKNQYCKDNNINLLRIPYWEGNNIEDVIAKELKLNL